MSATGRNLMFNKSVVIVQKVWLSLAFFFLFLNTPFLLKGTVYEISCGWLRKQIPFSIIFFIGRQHILFSYYIIDLLR